MEFITIKFIILYGMIVQLQQRYETMLYCWENGESFSRI